VGSKSGGSRSGRSWRIGDWHGLGCAKNWSGDEMKLERWLWPLEKKSGGENGQNQRLRNDAWWLINGNGAW